MRSPHDAAGENRPGKSTPIHAEANFFNKMYERAREQGRSDERISSEDMARELALLVDTWSWGQAPSITRWVIILKIAGGGDATVTAPTQRDCIQQALVIVKGNP